MKTIRVDPDIFDRLGALAMPGESPGDVLRRVIAGHVVEVDDGTYSELVSRSEQFGESPSDVIRRILRLPGSGPTAPDVDDEIIEFHVLAGTGAQPWNSQADAIRARVGQTLRIVNDDGVAHRIHTDGEPFAHPSVDIAPGQSADYLLAVPFTGRLYDHSHGQTAEIWFDVTAPD